MPDHSFRHAQALGTAASGLVQARLSGTETTLPQIAQATGFCHQAYFGAVFKSQTGMTPSQFREEDAIHAP